MSIVSANNEKTRPTKKPFNSRAFVAVAAAVAGLGLPLTGFANHLLQMDSMTPRRHAWMSAHNSLGAIFVVFTVWHVILNRRVLLNYIRGAASQWRNINREVLWAAGLVTFVVVVAVVSTCTNPNGGNTCLTSRGTYCCIDLTTSSNFTQALENAVSSNIVNNVKPSCNFSVPQSTGVTYVDLQHTLVQYVSGAGVTQDLTPASSANCTDGGFYYNDATNVTQLNLCPSACDTLQADPAGVINVTFECSPIG